MTYKNRFSSVSPKIGKVLLSGLLLGLLLLVSCRTGRVATPLPLAGPDERSVVGTPLPLTPILEGEWHQSSPLQMALDSLLQDSLLRDSQVGISIYDLTLEREIYAHQTQQRMRPASCQKLVTAIAALHFLGNDYALRTRLCMDGEVLPNGTLNGNIYILGGMDPLLSSDEVGRMATALKESGVRQINGLMYADLSMKDDQPLGWGWCWDDDYGPLTALSVDGKDKFREVWLDALKDCRIKVTKKQESAGRPRIEGILLAPQSGCLPQASCPDTATMLLEISHPVSLLLQKMMKESDNIYAESLFYQLAAHSKEKKAGRRQAAQFIQNLTDSLGISRNSLQVADGSGLSLYNYTTPACLTLLLRHAYRQAAIRDALLPTLPICGVDGTLKRRMKQSVAYQRVQAKTGTVTGISSLSGYASTLQGHTLCFSIINQGVEKGSLARAWQDKVCEAMVALQADSGN